MAPSVMIDIGTLGRLDPLSRGGQADLFRVPDLHLRDAPADLVFKRYRSPARSVSASGLSRIVHVRHNMSREQRLRLDEATAWPVRIVAAGSIVLGVVMPLIDASYFANLTLPSGKQRSGPREVQYLFVDPSKSTRLGLEPPSLRDRAMLCKAYAFALGILHKAEVVFGDISAKNALYRTRPRPGVMMVDCDAVRMRGQGAVVSQLHTADWDPPEGLTVQSELTDRYKLGLFILRALTPGDFSSVNRNPAVADAVLSAPGRTMLRRSLLGDPDERPAARDWYYYFKSGRPAPPRRWPS